MERRWVIYNGEAEASTVPPSVARLAAPHRRRAADPGDATSRDPGRSRTGRTSPARRARSVRAARRLAQGRRPKATGDYKAWDAGTLRSATAQPLPPFPAAFRVLTGRSLIYAPTPDRGSPKPAWLDPLFRRCFVAAALAGACGGPRSSQSEASSAMRRRARRPMFPTVPGAPPPRAAIFRRPAGAPACRPDPAARPCRGPEPALAAAAGRDDRPAAAPAAAACAPARPAQPPSRRRRSRRTAPQPNDEIVIEPPTQKIANPTAVFSGLDKITGRIITFDVAIDETVQFGALQVTPRVCYTRPPTETPNTDGFVEVDEVTLQGEVQAHLHRVDVRREPGAACGRASDLRRLAHRLQRRRRSRSPRRRRRRRRRPPAPRAAQQRARQPRRANGAPAAHRAAALRTSAAQRRSAATARPHARTLSRDWLRVPSAQRGDAAVFARRQRRSSRRERGEIGIADQRRFQELVILPAATPRPRRTSSDDR